MVATETILFHRLADILYGQLRPDDQVAVTEFVARASNIAPADWPSNGIEPVEGDSTLFLGKAGDKLCVVLQKPPGEGPFVYDIFSQEGLKFYKKYAR